MSTAPIIRQQVEAALARKNPGALQPRLRSTSPPLLSGIKALDDLLQGGLASAAITELVGTPCSGRTTAALAYLAAMTQAGQVCAWVDVGDALDPESAAAQGVDLDRLLWVRCGGRPDSVAQAVPEACQEAPTAAVAPDAQPWRTGGGSPHPRSEGKDMPEAIRSMLHAHGGLYDKQTRREKRSIGTPGMPNRPLTERAVDREEQVNSDRLPPRRGANLALAPHCAEMQPRRVPQHPARNRLPLQVAAGRAADKAMPWQAIDQALRATDLLLQAGGFSILVLDLGSVPPEAAWRIPLATWFRFRAACERTRVSLLVLTQHSCARSSAEVVVRLQAGSLVGDSKVMLGVRYGGEAERSRAFRHQERVVSIRRPPRPERDGIWMSEATWALAR